MTSSVNWLCSELLLLCEWQYEMLAASLFADHSAITHTLQ
jgi:hypothetical protein